MLYAFFTGPKPVWDNSESYSLQPSLQEASLYNFSCSYSFSLYVEPCTGSVLLLRDFTSVSGIPDLEVVYPDLNKLKTMKQKVISQLVGTLLQFPTISLRGARPFRDWDSLKF